LGPYRRAFLDQMPLVHPIRGSSRLTSPSSPRILRFRITTIGTVMSSEFTDPDIHSWRKLLPYTNTNYSKPLYHSGCHCGRVKFSVNTEPLDAKLCHCRDCRVMHGAPMQHAAIFEKQSVQFEEGSLDHVRFYSTERGSNRGSNGEHGHGQVPGLPRKVSCSHCGSRLADGMIH